VLEWFLFVGLPYMALALFVVGTTWRFLRNRYSISSLSSQLLEDRWLGAGSVPWHIGILLIAAGHIAALLVPGLWRSVLSHPPLLYLVETVGIAAAVASGLGLVTLLGRRILRARLQTVTSWADYIVLCLLLCEVAFGLLTALTHRWGSLWATGTLVPYLMSLLRLGPDTSLVNDLSAVVKTHVVVAFVIVGVTPFTRLVHALFVPLEYLFRSPQKVVWTSERRRAALRAVPGGDPDVARRHLIEGVVGAGAATALLGVGAAEKAVQYFARPRLSQATQAKLLNERHLRISMTAEERALELERLSNDSILVCAYSDLEEKDGKYFIDFEMRPALAFLGSDGMPTLFTAKCTHLGCTVGNTVDDKGRILCPCHVSYFDVKTGVPDPTAPAKAPLRRLAWAIKDEKGKVLASMNSQGELRGHRDPTRFHCANLYVLSPSHEEVT
jgi:nitrate reductase gamma subunit